MAPAERLTTILSTKGQVILPKPIRDHHRWDTGTRLTVENTADGVLLKPASVFVPTRPQDVFGSLPWQGEPKSISEMKRGIRTEAKQRHARNR